MDRVVSFLDVVRQAKHADEDFVDRLHFRTTAYFLICCALCIFAKEYGGGLHVRALVTMARTAEREELGLSSEKRIRIAGYIFQSFKQQHDAYREDDDCCLLSRLWGRFVAMLRRNGGVYRLTFFYCITKCLFIAVSCLQLVFVSRFLGTRSSLFGFDSLAALHRGDSWETTGLFPRISMCDFEIRGMADVVERHTVQCVLMANMINEKIFVAVWWWLSVLMTLGAMNLFHWLFILMIPKQQVDFIQECVMEGNAMNDTIVGKERQSADQKRRQKLAQHRRALESARPVGTTSITPSTLRNRLNDSGAATMSSTMETGGQLPLSESQWAALEERVFQWHVRMSEQTAAAHEVEHDAKFRVHHPCRIPEFLRFIGPDGVLLFRLMQTNSSMMVVSQIASQLYHDFYVDRYGNDLSDCTMSTFSGDEAAASPSAKQMSFHPCQKLQ
ncbi:Innexin [Aphelenchoides fujianensis]|nr:Innexin [Aphelenchoides fujianensis]